MWWVYYENEPYRARPSRVFAYYCQPPAAARSYPGVVLVHGWGMEAVEDWARYWANRGYAALVPDLNGRDPNGPMADRGPTQSDAEFLTDTTGRPLRDYYSYHAVAAIVRGVSLLAAQPGVDPQRVGVHGISLGGMLSAVAAGLDTRVRAAALVFGAGYAYEDGYWADWLSWIAPPERARWIENFDASRYLPWVDRPILFASGATDAFYPFNMFQHSYLAASPGAWLVVKPEMDHGYIWRLPGVDANVNRFLDSSLGTVAPLPRLGTIRWENGRAAATAQTTLPLGSAALHYTPDLGPWKNRRWLTLPAQVRGTEVSAPVPTNRPLSFYFEATDVLGGSGTCPYVTAGRDSPEGAPRFTAIREQAPQRLVLEGSKAWGHRVAPQTSSDLGKWFSVSTNVDNDARFLQVVTNLHSLTNGLYRAQDLDW